MPRLSKRITRENVASLRRNRDERYQTIKDFLLDVKNLKRELERSSGRFAVDNRLLLLADALDEMTELKLERLLLCDWHRLANYSFTGELADNGGVLGMKQLAEQ